MKTDETLKDTAKLQNVQILRALAAIMVVLCHGAGEMLKRPAAPLAILQFPSQKCLFGVDIFFVISGFIMYCISRNKVGRKNYAAKFFASRLGRVVPLYWLVTTLMIAVSALAPGLKHNNPLRADYILASYFFIPMPDPLTGAPQPLVGLGWTLNWEMFFYTLFAICIAVFARRALPAIASLLFLLFLIGIIPSVQQAQPTSIPQYWTHSIILEFLFGIIIGKLFDDGRRLAKSGGIACILLGLGFWVAFGPAQDFIWRGIIWGIPAALIVGGTILGLKESRTYRSHAAIFAIMVGDTSYSLYLTHLFVMRPVSLLLNHVGLAGAAYPICFFALFIPAAIGTAWLSYRFFELPTNHFSQKLIRSW